MWWGSFRHVSGNEWVILEVRGKFKIVTVEIIIVCEMGQMLTESTRKVDSDRD